MTTKLGTWTIKVRGGPALLANASYMMGLAVIGDERGPSWQVAKAMVEAFDNAEYVEDEDAVQ